jgi:Mg2+ and Co2+ transporter CorA
VSAPRPSPHPLFAQIDRVLNDNLLGFLALLSLFVALAPSAFTFNAQGEALLGVVELLILGVFAIEYFSALMASENRQKFVLNPWRILDALIVLAGFLALMPPVHDLFRNSPVLRLVRFARLALFGTRTGSAMVGASLRPGSLQVKSGHHFEAYALKITPEPAFDSCSWDEVLERVDSHHEDWLVLSSLDDEKIRRIADALAVPEASLTTRFHDAPFPRIERMENYTTIFIWYPALPTIVVGETPTITRTAVLLVASAQNVVTLTRDSTDLPNAIPRRLSEMEAGMPVLVRTTAAFLKAVVRRYARISDALESALLRIEAQQSQLKDQAFLDETFRLRAEISRVRGSLKHLTLVIRQLADRPVAIQGFELGPRPAFTALADDAETLYDSVDDQLDNLGALVDLRLNISSFQMNKVMRLLAILTALTLIPAVTGGLLGMNLSGNPWPPTLLQVTYGLAFGMASCLYVFAVKGWLR